MERFEELIQVGYKGMLGYGVILLGFLVLGVEDLDMYVFALVGGAISGVFVLAILLYDYFQTRKDREKRWDDWARYEREHRFMEKIKPISDELHRKAGTKKRSHENKKNKI